MNVAATVGDRVRAAWDLAWNQGNIEALDQLLAPDYVRTSLADPKVLDREGMKRLVADVRRGFPDLRTEIDQCIEADGSLAVLWRSQGTHLGEYYGVPPTGKTVQAAGASFFRARGVVVVEEVETWDPRDMLAVLGIHRLRSHRAKEQ